MATSIQPTNVSRVTMLMKTNMFNHGMRSTTVDMLKVQNQLSTGLKLGRPSDSPAEATTIMHLDSVIEQQGQYLTNMGYADDFLAASDSALDQAVNLAQQAYTLAMEDADADGRQANALIIDQILEQMVSIANSTCRGTYIFAGQNRTVLPFERYAGGVMFHGDLESVQTQVAFDNAVGFNANGNEVFGVSSGQVVGTADLNPDITLDTMLSDLNGAQGLGIRLGAITINVGVQTDLIDVTGCVTVGDLINRINNNSPLTGATATIASDDSSIQITATGPLTVGEVGSGTTAADLGLATPDWVAGNILKGQDVDARLTLATPVSALAGGAGIDLSSGLNVSNSLLDPMDPIDLSGAQTVEDILNTINNANAGIHAQLNADGTGFNVTNLLSGSELRIGEVAGGSTASDLGLRSMTRDTALSTLNNGNGIHPEAGVADIQITDRQGDTCDVNLDGAETVGDVIDLINAAAAAAVPVVNVTASLAADGNGITLTDSSGGGGDLTVTRINNNGYFIDQELGLDGAASGNVLSGDDLSSVQSQGVFAHLIALRDALRSNVQTDIDAAINLVEEDRETLSNMHGRVGAQMRALEGRKERMQDNILATETLRSDIRDIDFAEAITRYENLQAALQANLMAGQYMNSVSLLDFLR